MNDDNTRRYKLPSPRGLPFESMPEVNYFRYVEVLFYFIFRQYNEETLRFTTKQHAKLLFFATGYDILQSQTRAQTTKLLYKLNVVHTMTIAEERGRLKTGEAYIDLRLLGAYCVARLRERGGWR